MADNTASVTHTQLELEEAASHVQGEWALLASMAALLPAPGGRTPQQTAAMEATLLHARCVINFCCGGYTGRRHVDDIQPSDFLGADWWPRDQDFDRKLRGRLRFINQELQHLSWQRVLNKAPFVVAVILVAHEAHWGMRLFVDELRVTQNVWMPRFEFQEQYGDRFLPALRDVMETKPHLAPRRAMPQPP